MAGRSYGTDPYGIIARGDPSARGGSSVSVGRVGNVVRDYSSPGRSFGSGVGATLSLPMKTKSKAKGGEIKKSGCSVKAYGDMIKKAAGGKVQTSADTARKLATEMGGMKKGGKPKSGLAVMIAIGAPMKSMKKPVKKALGGGMDAKLSRAITGAKADMARMDPTNVRTLTRGGLGKSMGVFAGRSVAPERMGAPVKRAAGGVGKMRKGMCDAPEKLARGGAGKVRKGMMSPSGQILQAVKPKMK